MRQPVHLAAFYRQLAALLEAGVSLERALQSLEQAAPGRRLRAVSAALRERIRAGGDLSDALADHPAVFPVLHRELLRVGERTGTVDAALQQLAAMMEQLAAIRKEVIIQLLYPALLLHMALLVTPLPTLIFTRDFSAYGRSVLGGLLFLYALAGMMMWMARQISRDSATHAAADRLVLAVPVVGKIHRDFSLARFFSTLKALLGAGIGILEAMPRAGAASGSAKLAGAARESVPALKQGDSLITVMAGALPPEALGLMATGQASGKLDDMLDHLERYFLEESRRRLRALAEWLPKFIYVGVVLWVGWRILQMGIGYSQFLQQMMG